MKVAFATNDRKTIAQHTGRAKEFAVYELSAYEVINIEYYINEQHDHNHWHSHKGIVEKLIGTDYLYALHLGKHFKEELEKVGIENEMAKENDIMSVVKDFFEEEAE